MTIPLLRQPDLRPRYSPAPDRTDSATANYFYFDRCQEGTCKCISEDSRRLSGPFYLMWKLIPVVIDSDFGQVFAATDTQNAIDICGATILANFGDNCVYMVIGQVTDFGALGYQCRGGKINRFAQPYPPITCTDEEFNYANYLYTRGCY